MSSPRRRTFFKELASSIRTERTLQEQEREENATEVRALQQRLMRLQMWEQYCENMWEEREHSRDYIRRGMSKTL